MKQAVTIRHLFVSPGHNFFGHHGRPAGAHPSLDLPSVQCRAGLGLEGDRFFGYRPDYGGQVTFFDWAAYVGIREDLAVPGLRPDAFRRNVIIEGMPLRSLIGARFAVGGVEFEGMSEAKPCHWMDAAVAPGAEAWLKGRGGLRARILTDGLLRVGPAELRSADLLALS